MPRMAAADVRRTTLGGIAKEQERVRGMHLRGLDMNLLIALDALIKDKSISRSGERLHLSQSGMSTALGRLRDYFSDQLLVRIGRQMVLTPLAESLADPVHDVVLQVQAIIDHA